MGHLQLLWEEGSLPFNSSHHSCYVIPRRLCYVIQKLYHAFKLCLLGLKKKKAIIVELALSNCNY